MISAILLAAGEGKRMERIKPLVKIKGKPMIQIIFDKIKAAKVDEKIIVLGFMADTIINLFHFEDSKLIINKNFREGMGSSLALGIKALDSSSSACLIFLADKPFVSIETINRIIDIYYEYGGEIIVPCYKGDFGHPVLFDRKYYSELAKLKGDIGAKELLNKYADRLLKLEVNDKGILIDIDTEEDLKRFINYPRIN
ncbi:MAG: nucleotidyltransferase family protein [Nitrososphaerales archaeon]